MKKALLLLGAVAGLFISLRYAIGYDRALVIAYGAVIALALSISVTFFWLWLVRATPLALGMGFSWAGTTGVLGWWWLYRLLDRPEAMTENITLLGFVSAYFVGAILHFRVMGRSLGWGNWSLFGPLLLALTVAGVVGLVA